jgi:MtaA/CmuA family methyltransferase
MNAVLSGKALDYVPIFPKISFACANAVPGMNIAGYMGNPDNMACAIITACKKYGWDAVGITTDIANEGMALGSLYERPPDATSKLVKYLLDEVSEYDKVIMPDPLAVEPMKTIIKAVEICRKEIGDEIYITVWCNAPLNVASQLVRMDKLLIELMDDPETVHLLLDRCCLVTEKYAEYLVKAGADAVSFGHAMASNTVISGEQYKEFALPYEKRIVNAIHKAGAKAITHICGKIEGTVGFISENGSDIIDFDHQNSFTQLKESCPQILRGNIDPVIFSIGSSQQVYEKTKELVNEAKGSNRLILGSGCEITQNTQPENLFAFVKAGRDYGKY